MKNTLTLCPSRYGAALTLCALLCVHGSWLKAAEEAAQPVAQPAAPSAAPSAASPVATQPRFNVAVSGAPAQAFFQGLADGTSYNMLVDPDVSGSITLTLKQVTIEQALEAARDLYGFDFRRTSSGYLILPATLQSRVWSLNYLDLQRYGVSKTRISSGQVTQG